ncbi:MAG: hypothetical protein WCY59_08810 [Anaerovoracaceae bacterium]|jgi:hypothetical protein
MPQPLFDYGIQTEKSDIRTHVCPTVRRVYVYPTESGLIIIEKGNYPLVPGFQPGYAGPTSEGYLVPPDDIPYCVELKFRDGAWDHLKFRKEESTSEKGRKAVLLVKMMLKRGLLPIPTESEIVEERDIQISGTDIFVRANSLKERDVHIQVKCDFDGGRKELGGTGNLFLQVKEINPFGLY